MAIDARPESAEALGTFLMLLAGGLALLAGLPAPAVALAFGGAILVLVYALGHVSGAHFNPAVTLAFAVVGHFPWRRVPGYLAAQATAAVAAAWSLSMVGPVAPVVARGSLSGPAEFLVEAGATFLLAFVIVAVATDRRAAPGATGLAIGMAVLVGSLAAGPFTGAGMNPARALGPALVAQSLDGLATHLVAPVVGAVGAMGTYEWLRAGRVPKAGKALGSVGPFDLEAA